MNRRLEDGEALDIERASLPVENSKEVDQDGGYSWVCVICQLLITANTWGINGVSGSIFRLCDGPGSRDTGIWHISYALYHHEPIPRHLKGHLRLHTRALNLANHFHWTPRYIFQPPARHASDARDWHSALVASGFATKVWHLFLTQGVVFGWGCGFLYVGSIGIILNWFKK